MYLQVAIMEDDGASLPNVEAALSSQGIQAFPTNHSTSSRSGSRNPRDEYWLGNAPVQEKVEYNGETLMLPKLAPKDEREVGVRKVIFDRTITSIEEHQGGSKVNWNWKVQFLNTRLQPVVPAGLTVVKTMLPTLTVLGTPRVYTYSDIELRGADIRGDVLPIDDPGVADGILPASRNDCRWISATLTFNPQAVVAQGTVVDPRELPAATSLRIHFRAPQRPAGGLADDITKTILRDSTRDIFATHANVVLCAMRNNYPVKDAFDTWIQDQWNHTWFSAMKQCAKKTYIGTEVPTDTLKQRFYRLNQRMWDNHQRKNVYLSVSQLQTRYLQLIDEINPNAPNANELIPELDTTMYHALIARLRNVPALATATQHAASTTFGENVQRLQAFVDEAKKAEKEIDRIVAISQSTLPQHRRQGINTASTPNRSQPVGNAFLTAATGNGTPSSVASMVRDPNTGTFSSGSGFSDTSGVRGGMRDIVARDSNPSVGFPDIPEVPQVMTLLTAQKEETTLAWTYLSNAEDALRRSSGTNAPPKCWGCEGIYPDFNHLFRDCPHKKDPRVQTQFRANLDEFLKKRQERRFEPNNYRRDGFPTKKAASLFNSIVNQSVDANTRLVLLNQLNREISFHDDNAGRNTRSQARLLQHEGNDDHQEYNPASNVSGGAFTFWSIGNPDEKISHDVVPKTFHSQVEASTFIIRYPIASELPHVCIPVGKQGQSTVEGLLDTGGACTMGDLIYWREVAARNPQLVLRLEELHTHLIKPIAIGGVGEGKVEVTHVLELWMPWIVNGVESRLVIGLGEKMPVTLLIGLPFIVAAQCTLDLGNLKCHSHVFNDTWKLTLKVPHKKTLRSLDAASVSTGKRVSFPALAPITPSPKRNRLDDAASVFDTLQQQQE